MCLYFVQRLKVDTYGLTSLALREGGAYKKYGTLSTYTTKRKVSELKAVTSTESHSLKEASQFMTTESSRKYVIMYST